MTRRAFLGQSGRMALGLAVFGGQAGRRVPDALDLSRLAPFVDPLPVPIVSAPTGVRATPHGDAPVHRITLQAVTAKIHRDLPPTHFWSFGNTFPGPTIEARKGGGLWIDWVNRLPARHFLPIDHTIHGAERGVPDVRAVVHVHGARVRPEHDGHPEKWTTPGATSSFYYPNDQDAATLWYHDHTMGINRLNVYAGLFGTYLIRDDEEDALGVPTGAHDVPLLFCDRMLDAGGQLVYPVSDNPAAPWVPEVAGDAMLVNGRLLPYLDVEARVYRFRLINASNGNFLRLSLDNRAPLHQIGGDQGLLERVAASPLITISPAERADVLVDFTGRTGERVALVNGRHAIVQFRVGRAGEAGRGLPALSRRIERLAEAQAVRTRTHSLAEAQDLVKQPMRMLINDTPWHAPVTETPTLDSIEVWNLVNETDDGHPIHLHLVRFQILDRRTFDQFAFRESGQLRYTGPVVRPEPGEMGWKDTVRADPGMVTRIIVRFEGYAGRYMWHCHLLEHGDNEMMRPLEILPAK